VCEWLVCWPESEALIKLIVTPNDDAGNGHESCNEDPRVGARSIGLTWLALRAVPRLYNTAAMSEPALTADGAPHCIASEKSELPPEVDRASPFTVEIPGSDDVLANGIAWSAFDGCSGLTSVTMPEGVIHIGDHAFDGCSGLVSIVLPESVSRIRDCAFSECSGLTSIVLPEGVTHIGTEAFYGCAGLTSVILPKGVSRIEDDAFSDCTWLVVVRLLSRDSIYVSSVARGGTSDQ
jgi:hypothetical protein